MKCSSDGGRRRTRSTQGAEGVEGEAAAAVPGRRLRALRLVGRPLESPEEVVAWLGVVQAQDFAPAKWAIGQRTEAATDADIGLAYAAGTVLRTHVLRPTWHFVLPADIRVLLAATAPRIQTRIAHRYRRLGLDADALARSVEALTEGLSGGNALTREEVRATLRAARIDADGQRLAYMLMNAELNAVVCSGPPRGSQHTYALLEERAPGARVASREAALSELALRFFTSHGPATAKDFATWASLTQADVRLALATASERLQREVIGDLVFWSSPAPAAPPLASPVVHLLQGYDEYIMGYSETKHLLARAGSSWSAATPPVFSLVVLLDGHVAGFWRRVIARDHVTVEVSLFRPFDGEQAEALNEAAARYGVFLDLPARVVYRNGR